MTPFSASGNSGTTTPQPNHAAGDVSVASQRPCRVPRYWPTTPLTREEAIGALHVAKLQDEAVLAIFRRLHGQALTPSQVHRIGVEHGGRQWLITSVRRSITNLTDDGVLQRLDALRRGPHGKPEHVWTLTAALPVAA